jgi:DNA modification methylase
VKIAIKEIVLVDPRELKPHPHNKKLRKHSKEAIERTALVLEYQGWRYPIIVSNQSGYINVGHKRQMAALLRGWEKVPVSYQDFESDEQEISNVISDNALNEWDAIDRAGVNDLVVDLGPDFNFDWLGLKDFTLDVADKFEGDPDAVPETPKEAKTKRGELWTLGNHKILCGDATDKADVERLMCGEKADMVFTDPPYGMNLDTDYSQLVSPQAAKLKQKVIGKKYAPVTGDDKPYDPRPLLDTFSAVKEVFLWGADYYHHRLPEDGTFLIWDKSTEAADEMIGNAYEICWSKQKHKKVLARVFQRGAFGSHPTDDGSKAHPTQKPVKLAQWFFERWANGLDSVVDVYLGSGSTLIACEKTQRRCFGMEIEPLYIDVILERWAKFTGKDPVREDGTTWSKLKSDG